MIKTILKSIFQVAGIEVRRRRRPHVHRSPMDEGLHRWSNLGASINTIVDVGAAKGEWSSAAAKIWTDASFVLFEPLLERKEVLQQLSRSNPRFHLVPCAAGKEKGQVFFAVSDDLDGSGVTSLSSGESVRRVDVASIQDEVTRLNLPGPYLIKLDTHGFEIPILEGCEKIIPDVSLFIIECYGFQIAPNSLLFWEMCQHMERMGFRLFDLVDVMRRAKDGAFWQCDAFFIRQDNLLFEDNTYS